MSKEPILLSPPHMSGQEQLFIDEAFETNWIAPVGPHIRAFEQEMATYLGVKDAVALNSGTSAIHMALCVLGVQKGDTVFCSTLTFVASANPIVYQEAEPVFIDSEPETWNMSPKALQRALTQAANQKQLPKAVIVVHLYGQSAKMEELLQICQAFEVPLVEDAAESLGTTYKQKSSGTMGTFGIYSFNGNKIITTSGGGMLVSNNTEAINHVRFLATQAKDPAPYYQHSQTGYNYRLSNVLAGIGRAQLQVLQLRVAARRRVFDLYKHHLNHLPGIFFMPELMGTRMNRWLTAFTLNESQSGVSVEQLLEELQANNVEVRRVWKPLHMQPLFANADFYPHEPNNDISSKLFASGICLPSGSNLDIQDQLRIIKCITDFIQPDEDDRYNIPKKQEV